MLKVPQLPALLKTWCQFHVAWFGQQTLGEEFSPFPLTVMKICAVGAMLKSGGYRSAANYLSRAKEEVTFGRTSWRWLLERPHPASPVAWARDVSHHRWIC